MKSTYDTDHELQHPQLEANVASLSPSVSSFLYLSNIGIKCTKTTSRCNICRDYNLSPCLFVLVVFLFVCLCFSGLTF